MKKSSTGPPRFIFSVPAESGSTPVFLPPPSMTHPQLFFCFHVYFFFTAKLSEQVNDGRKPSNTN